jgi:uncharacterized membrane protein YhaH (DUF805 family)
MFVLFQIVIGWLIVGIEWGLGVPGVVSTLYSLATLIPSIAVTTRRLHDTGRSGWWQLIALLPLVGAIILLVFLVSDGEANPNQYGPNPKTAAAIQPAL